MKKPFSLVVILGAVGLVVGYFLFGKAGGSYVGLGELLGVTKGGLVGSLQKIGSALMGVEQIRQNILISGGVGAVLGLVASFVGARPRK